MSAVTKFYDTLDPLYRACWGWNLHHGWYATGNERVADALGAFRRQLVNRLDLRSGQRVCDVGCGYGTFAAFLASGCLDLYVVGVTNSSRQAHVGLGMRDGNEAPIILERDWLQNDLSPDSFDRIVAVESLYHMTDQTGALSEIERVLTRGGKALLTLWSGRKDSFTDRAMRVRDDAFGKLSHIDEWTAAIKGCGFQLNALEDWTPMVAPTLPAIARRAAGALWEEPDCFQFVLHAPAAALRLAAATMGTAIGYFSGSLRYHAITVTKTG